MNVSRWIEFADSLTFGEKFVVGGVFAFLVLATVFCNGYMSETAAMLVQSPDRQAQPTATPIPFDSPVPSNGSFKLHRWYDAEADVVCWTRDGIYCMPRTETALELP